MVLASVEFGASIIDKDKRKKYFGEDKVHFFIFFACDVISMVSMCLLGLGIGDVLKSDTALAASGLCFILFVSYAITTVLLFLALRGDLPSLSKPEIPVVGVCIEETDMAGDAHNAKSNAVNNNVQIVEVSSVVIKEDKS